MSPKAKPKSLPSSAPVPAAIARLRAEFPEAACSLEHVSPLQLLVATILSAQCTDARVNMVTPRLFEAFPDARSLAEAPPGAIEEIIRSTGFFNAKGRSIRGMAQKLVAEFGGKVPNTMEELTSLPGTGRKTANVVLGNVWNKPEGVVVDTHVGRIARRLGWTAETDPEKVEKDLGGRIPMEDWVWISHALILHGRKTCDSRNPKCSACTLSDLCPKTGVEPKQKGASA